MILRKTNQVSMSNFAIERNADRNVGFGFANVVRVSGLIIFGGFVRVRSSLKPKSKTEIQDIHNNLTNK